MFFYTMQVVSYMKYITKDLVVLYAFVEMQKLFQRSFAGNIILLIYKDFSSVIFSLIGMLISKTVVLDIEQFPQRKGKIIVKKFVICTEEYLDCVIFTNNKLC